MEEEIKEDVVLRKEYIIEEYLKSKDFIDLINAEKGKSIENWQKEKLPGLLDTEFEKRIKLQEERNKKSPEQIQLEEALKRIEKMELETAAERRDKLKFENKAHAISELSNKNLKVPESILDKFISDKPDETTENLKLFTDFIDDYTTSIKTEKIKSNNTFESGDGNTGGGKIPIPGEDATVADWEAYHRATRSK